MNSRTIFAVPYLLTRTPLSVVDAQLARRVPKDFKPRIVFDRALGSYDMLAGRLLGDGDLARRGMDRVTRSAKIAEAVELEHEAAQQREAAETVATTGEQQATETAKQAKDRLINGFEEAEAKARAGERAAAANARSAAARKKQRAEERAARRLAEVEQKAARVEAAANRRAATAQKAAKTKLEASARQRGAARTKRSEAAQLSELKTAKRQSRVKA